MSFNKIGIYSFSTLALVFGLGGCSSDTTSGAPAGSGGGVSFAHDVVPIFQMSCNINGASCHGDPQVATMGMATGSTNRTYLGPPSGAVDAASILNAMVGKSSFEDPAMKVVTAGDPVNSFLIRKMDNDFNSLAGACQAGTLGSCGVPMPLGMSVLPKATRDTIRSWISQGALNN